MKNSYYVLSDTITFVMAGGKTWYGKTRPSVTIAYVNSIEIVYRKPPKWMIKKWMKDVVTNTFPRADYPRKNLVVIENPYGLLGSKWLPHEIEILTKMNRAALSHLSHL
jgi:hypothetical protein